MLSRLKAIFQTSTSPEGAAHLSEAQKRLACAALMVEVAVIDSHFDMREMATLKRTLATRFAIQPEELDDLIQAAESEIADSTSMFQFTQLINNHCSAEEKFDLIAGMWRVAYADNNIDKYEEFIIRKSADLIHLPHSEFIRAKHAARIGTT